MRSLKRSLKAYWELLRLEHGIMYGLGVLIGIFLGGGANLELLILGFVTAVFLEASAFAMNDYLDYDVDVANKRLDRPLVRGDLSKKTALALTLLFFPLGLISALLISIEALFFVLLVTLLAFAYNAKLKELGLLGNAYVAFTMSAPFIFGGIISDFSYSVLLLSLIAFLSGLGREIMKGIEDVEGDALRNVKSVARVHGIEKAVKLSSFFFIFAVSLSFLPPILISEYYDPKYAFPVAITDLMLISVALRLPKNPEKIPKFRKETLLAMLFGLIGFLAGAF
ncbi:MAG: UbiA family prenyltransferase [Archaeoglobaceae archaeon]|nr:UbiA family prenyltransferase [Archaeoglobaceae archaeon]MDW8117834.1 UbiA family prenyltransferase [Archaeoglobaceae archaeon]